MKHPCHDIDVHPILLTCSWLRYTLRDPSATDLRLALLPLTPSPSSFTYLTETLLDDDDSARDFENAAASSTTLGVDATFEFPAPDSSIMASASSGTTGTTVDDADALDPAEVRGPDEAIFVDVEVPACRDDDDDCCLDLLDRFL